MSGDAPSSLHDRPVLAIDPGFHTGVITCVDIDAAGRIAATGSIDGSVRIWSLADGGLKRTIRLPKGLGHIGQAFATALSRDGKLVAAGGWTRTSEEDQQEQIYIFSAIGGMMRQRIDGLPEVVNHLAFSPAGDRLAAAVGTGLRLYALDDAGRWTEIAADHDYGDTCWCVAFAADGRFATTSYDNRIRLYGPEGGLTDSVASPHARPVGLAFNPADDRLAVGFDRSYVVALHDGASLAPLGSAETGGIGHSDFARVAWSADGATLFAGGKYSHAVGGPIVAWDGGVGGRGRLVHSCDNTITGLRPLPDGALLAVSADPWLGEIGADGLVRWAHAPGTADLRNQHGDLALSTDGLLVEFGLRIDGEDRRRFDMEALRLSSPCEDGRVQAAVQDGLDIRGWTNGFTPTLDGAPLPLEPNEVSRSVAIQPDASRFLLGSDWHLRAFDSAGAPLWRHLTPSMVWAVKISGDGRLAVSGRGDGTLRWHRMEDGAELLALFPLTDGENWVAWTPEGIYAATPGARSILRWHVNRGWDRAAEAIPVSEIPETNRPEVIRHVLPQMGTPGALAVTEMAKIRGAVRRATGSDVAPGARLHVLAIGISDYGDAARHLDLSYAHRDAHDVAAALRG